MVLALTLPLGGCGQPGPLYMPDKPPPSQVPRAQRDNPAASGTVPATAPTTAPAGTAN